MQTFGKNKLGKSGIRSNTRTSHVGEGPFRWLTEHYVKQEIFADKKFRALLMQQNSRSLIFKVDCY